MAKKTKKTKKTAAFGGASQEDMFKKLKKITKKDSFLMTVTIFNKKGAAGQNVDTYLLINDFPYPELEGTKEMIIKLIDGAKRKK